MSRNNLYNIDNQGNLRFSLRSSLNKEQAMPESKWEHGVIAVIIMFICAVPDFMSFLQVFNAIMSDSVLIRVTGIIAMLIGFDLAPILLGIVEKKRSQGLKSSKLARVVLIVAFITAFIWNTVLRIATRDIVLPNLSTNTISILENTASTNNPNALAMYYALFAASMPVITSFVSFAASFIASNPVKQHLNKLIAEQIELEDKIVELEAILLEYDSDPMYWERMLEDDEQKYNATLDQIHEQAMYYCDYVRERIKEHLGDPASSNELSKNTRPKLIRMFDENNMVSEEEMRKGA